MCRKCRLAEDGHFFEARQRFRFPEEGGKIEH